MGHQKTFKLNFSKKFSKYMANDAGKNSLSTMRQAAECPAYPCHGVLIKAQGEICWNQTDTS